MNYDIKVLYETIFSKNIRIEEVKQFSDEDGTITVILTGEYIDNPIIYDDTLPATFYDTLILTPTKNPSRERLIIKNQLNA